MKKRIFAGLLTLVMVFTLLPVSAMAEAGNWEQNLFNGFKSAYGTVVGTKSFTAATTFQIGKDGQLKVMPILEVPSGYTTITYNAMAYCGAKAASSNTDVVEVKQTDDGKQDICIGKWEGGDFHGADCLQVNVTPKKAGRAVVTISFYYTFSQSRNPFQNGGNTQWFKGTMQYTVKVTEPEPDPEVEYTLNYDANGGENAPTSQTAKSSTGSATFTIPEETPTRDNYDFKGWADSATATEAQYQPGGNIAVKHTDSPKTVYAVWEKDDSPTPDIPAPSYGDLKSAIGKIQVTDVSTPSCETKNYDLIDNTQSEGFNWTKTARLDQPGKYDVTIKTAPYVAKYNSEIAKAHELNDAGQTTLKLVISYKDKKWVLDDGKAEIEVKHTESTPTENPPKAPTADELKKLEMAVQVKCVVDDSQQHNGAYGLLGECDVDYFVGELRKDGDNWLCDISYDPDLYVAEFNKTFPTLKHIQNDEKIVPVTLIWAGNSWQLKTQGRVHVTEEYTVTFNAYGGFPTPDEQHVKSGEKAVLPVAPTLKGYTFAFWYLGEDEQKATAYNFDTPVTENITLTAKWNINKYTVTFDSNGGTPVPPAQEVEYGLTAVEPTSAPTKTGYTFDGWYLGNEKYNFSDAVEQDITLKAKWEPKQVVNVVIYRNGNFEKPYKTVALDKQSKGTVINLGKLNISDYYTPNATGKYKFYGWYNDGAWNNYKKDPANAPDGLNSVTVNGWTNIIAMVYDYEKVAVKAVYDNDKTGAKDIFVGEALHGSPLKAYLESNNIALDQPGYTHTEWYNWDWYAWEDHAVSANAKVNGWTNVYVAYKAIPYGVTYSYHNSVPAEVIDTLPTDKGTYTVKDQVTVQIPTAKEVAVDGYKWTFKGWQLDGKDVKSEQVNMTVGGLHFEGIWECEALPAAEYPVTYEYVSGTEGADLPWNVIDSLPVNEYTYAEGEKVTTAMKPDDMGFGEYTWKFQGWTLNGTAVAPNTQVLMAKGGLHFVGTWIRTSAQDEKYPVTYSYVSGVEGVELPEEVKATLPVNENTYTIGQQVPTAAKPADVTVGDYIWSLKAWKLGDNEIVPNNSVPMVEGGLNFVGIWTREKATVTVTFDANGGTVAPTSETITKGSTLTLPAPTRSGYRFDGWFTAADGGTQVNAGATFDKDTTLYAHWTKKSSGGGSSSRDYDYTLRYVTNGGKSIASETKSKSWTKDYEDLPMPTRAGYRFDGWYYDSALKNEVTGDVKVNSRTVTLYAGWTGSSVPDSLNGEDHFAYVQGYADGTVRPNTPVTRAQVATILFRLLDESVRKEYLTENNTFTDVAPNYWANTAISTMANMGVFKGRTADRFDPNAPITRGEFAAVCARFDDSKVKTTETYSDINGYWAANEILRAAALGWVQGYQDGSYRPNNSITRAQVVTMINRVLCRMPEKNADLLKGMSSFTDCAEDDWCYLAIQEATNSHGYKTKSGSIHEKWTDLNTAPDWSRFEH
ncbi:InlB B-repeat-containing protein [Dysosmobacter sp.]|uniref:InlB B-repeat-containing protein n=2 Tax=Dysosmobacter sp. TaxID=2591382 RepID=UPI003AAA9D81